MSSNASLVEADVDSLTMLEWVFAIEQELGIVLDEERVEHIDVDATIGDVIALLIS